MNEITRIDGATTSYGQERILEGDKLANFLKSDFNLKTIGLDSSVKMKPPSKNLMDYWHRLYPKQKAHVGISH